jgi:hypothetical protein
MAIALDYQTVYIRRQPKKVSIAWHLWGGIALFFALVTKIWITVECTEEGYKVAKLRQEAVMLDMERRELELHQSVLLKPDNLVMRSKKLGLKELNPGQAKRIVY